MNLPQTYFVFKRLASIIFRPCPFEIIPSFPVFVNERKCTTDSEMTFGPITENFHAMLFLKHFSSGAWNKTNGHRLDHRTPYTQLYALQN